ncbi:class F sortase [Streptomyces seoulensis]
MRPPHAHRLAATLLALPLAVALSGCGSDTPPAAPPPHIATAAPTASAPEATPAPMPASPPVHVTIPAAGVDTGPLLKLGLNADGTIEVPSVAQADRVGWYGNGVTPGETGPAVLVGHYDTVNGPAVMRNVARIKPGARVDVTREDGTHAVFTVTALEQVDKHAFPTRKVYGSTSTPQLRLITCGGAITAGHRPDNIIVYATLTNPAH